MNSWNGAVSKAVRVFACAMAFCTLTAGAATVEDLTVKTHYPWNGLVDVSCRVTGIDPSHGFVYAVSASVVTGATETVIYADVFTTNVYEDADFAFTWDATAAGFRGRAEDAKIVFTVQEASYLAIDLSAGPMATTYPVEAIRLPPTDDFYKTNSLLLRRIVAADGATTNYVGVYEVTQRQYELVTGENPSYYALYSDPTVDEEVRRTTEWKRPVERLSYETLVKADGFFDRLTNRCSGLLLGLPTTNEWQAAARGGMSAPNLYNLGSGRYGNLADTGWLATKPFRYGMTGSKVGNRNCSDRKGTAMVGSYEPNDLGLYDMHGNVSEWTRSTVVDPEDVSITNGVLCGGDYVSKLENCAVTSTRAVSQTDGSRFYYTGFRVFGADIPGAFSPPAVVTKAFNLDVATLPRQIRVADAAGVYTFYYTPTNGTERDWVAFDDAATEGGVGWKPAHHGLNVATSAADASVTAAFDVAPLAVEFAAEDVTVTYDREAHTIVGPNVTVPTANLATNYWCTSWAGQETEETAGAVKPAFSNAATYRINFKVTSPFYVTTNDFRTLTIDPAQITEWSFNPKPGQKVEFVYNGSNQTVRAAYVKAGGLTLSQEEYALSESNKVNVGTYTSVVHTISSNFSNPATEFKDEWKITPFDITGKEVVVLCENAIVSNGLARTIEDGNVTNVTCKGLVLKNGEYSFEENKQVCTGTYWTVMNATGNFKGSQSIRWEIQPAPEPVLAAVPSSGSGAVPVPVPAAAAAATAVTVSAVDIQALAGGSVQVTVTWTPGVTAGCTYTLVGKKDLGDENWTPLKSFTAEADSEAEADRRITVTTSDGYQFFTVEVK